MLPAAGRYVRSMRRLMLGALALAMVVVAAGFVTNSSAGRAAAAPGMRVFMVGDSTLATFSFAPAGLDVIEGSYSVAMDAAPCRRTTQPGCQPGGLPNSGVDVLRANVDTLKTVDVVVVMLGYN